MMNIVEAQTPTHTNTNTPKTDRFHAHTRTYLKNNYFIEKNLKMIKINFTL